MSVDVRTHDTHHPAPNRQPSLGRRIVWFLVVAVIMAGILGGLWYFNEFRKSMIAKFLSGNVPPPVAVVVVEAKPTTVEKSLTAIGGLQAVRQVVVAPEVAGRVIAVNFESGTKVKAGAPLVQLNDETEQASLASLKAVARLADITLDRASDLRRTQAGAQSAVDSARAQRDQAYADIRKTEVAIAQKRIIAPFDGELGIRKVNLGDYVSPGTPLVTLTDLSSLYVNLTLPEQNEGQVRVGQAVRVAVDAYPGRSFAGTVTTVDPQISADTRTLQIQGTIANPNRTLLPGMFANVRLMLPPESDVIVLPATAVDYSLYGDSVYLVRDGKDAEGKPKLTVERVGVTVGDQVGDSVAIRHGVSAGDRVVTIGQVKLTNGTAVTISDAAPPKPTDHLSTY